MNKLFCDHCRAEITPFAKKNTITFANYMEIKHEYDICESCRLVIEEALLKQ